MTGHWVPPIVMFYCVIFFNLNVISLQARLVIGLVGLSGNIISRLTQALVGSRGVLKVRRWHTWLNWTKCPAVCHRAKQLCLWLYFPGLKDMITTHAHLANSFLSPGVQQILEAPLGLTSQRVTPCQTIFQIQTISTSVLSSILMNNFSSHPVCKGNKRLQALAHYSLLYP